MRNNQINTCNVDCCENACCECDQCCCCCTCCSCILCSAVKKSLLCVLLYCSVILFSLPASAKAEVDYWTQLSVELYKTSNYQTVFFSDIWTRDNLESFTFILNEIKNNFKIDDHLTLGLVYGFVRLENSQRDWLNEQRPAFEINYKDTLLDFDYYMRLRTEYRIFDTDPQNDFIRERIKLKLAYPLKSYDAKLFVMNEAFYSENNSHWDQNRIYVGINYKNYTLSTGIQSLKSGDDWSSNKVVSLGFKF